MNDLIDIASNHGLTIIFHKFTDPVKGIYYPLHYPPVIGLHESLQEDLPLARRIVIKALSYHLNAERTGSKKAYIFSKSSDIYEN